MQNKILILSEKLDFHGVAVRWGLHQLGENVDCWERNLFPREQTLSFKICNDSSADLNIDQSESTCRPSSYKTIWNRRGHRANVSDSLNKADKFVAFNEARMTLTGMLEILEAQNSRALLVNRGRLVHPANAKSFQLLTAKRTGFKIPNTVISNNPDDVREFYKQHPQGIIAKMHFPFSWRDKDAKLHALWTTSVNEDLLTHDNAISSSPMIYQERLDIEEELRVIVIGQTTIAMSQKRSGHEDQDLADSRVETNPAYVFDVPEELSLLCINFTRSMQLTYSALDIAITKNGEYVFLESNESGQFLYLEESVPELPILDIFCRFLASGDPEFTYIDGKEKLSLLDFKETKMSQDFMQMLNAHMLATNDQSPFEANE